MTIVLKDATMLRDAAGRECAPASDIQIRCYLSDAVWTHHVQPWTAGSRRRSCGGLTTGWRRPGARRWRCAGGSSTRGRRPPCPTRPARLYEARRAEWSRRALEPAGPGELRRQQQAGNAVALLARTLRLDRSWVDAACPPPPAPRAA